MAAAKRHLKGQLGSEEKYQINTPNSKDSEGVQLADVVVNSYFKYLSGKDKVFEELTGKVIVREKVYEDGKSKYLASKTNEQFQK